MTERKLPKQYHTKEVTKEEIQMVTDYLDGNIGFTQAYIRYGRGSGNFSHLVFRVIKSLWSRGLLSLR